MSVAVAPIRLVTLNAGLLRRAAGLLEPAPHVDARARAIGPAIRALDPAIVALQEVYDARHREQIARDLAPMQVEHHGSGTLLDCGLMALSKARMRGRFQRFRAGPWDERCLTARGVLIVEIVTPAGNLTLFNVHSTAGALFSHPEAPAIETQRARQYAELLELANRRGVVVITGDLNAGPEASPQNFEQLLDAGWHDTGAGCVGPTWDPGNPLNVRGPHRTSPPQRIDHVLVRASDLSAGRISVSVPIRVLTEATVAVAGALVTPSDHYGVMLDLQMHS